ncbi:lantibiotic dehydratase [Streptomyces tendae]|uniref:lantibiotic dehydratase n=1 Tax=Streptomyces tendae TaxID=1932 RepID=UPI003D72A03E
MTPTEPGIRDNGAGAGTGRTTDARPGDHWEAGRRFALRAAGLPIEAVHGLRCPRTGRWADDVLAQEERLTTTGAQLSDLLHALVKSTTGPNEAPGDADTRRTLLNLRRQVFNNRLPTDPAAVVRLITERDPETGRRTARWLSDRVRLEALRAAGAEVLAGELRDSRRALREVLSDGRLRRGLLLASPTLDGRLDAYLRDTAPRPGNRLRKIERSALTYLYRTACKTSPFSTFTGVGVGTLAGDPADASARLGTGDSWVSHVRLNVVALSRLTELITADPERRQDLPVILSPGWEHDAGRIRYVRHVTTAGDDSAAVTFDAVRERLFFLRRSGTLERLLNWFGDHGDPVRHRWLVDWLEQEHDAGRDECERYARALMDLGMVQVAALRVDVHDHDPLQSYRDALRSLEVSWADRLAHLLAGAADCLARYPGADVEERRDLLGTLRSKLLDAQRELGSAEPGLPQTLVYEDVDTGDDLVCGPAVLNGETGRALRAFEGVLPLFDLTLPQRITLLGFFVARYGRGGRCEDLLGLVHDFHEDFFDQYMSFTSKRRSFDEHGAYVPEVNWLGQSEMKTLDGARHHFHEGMRDLWQRYGTKDVDQDIELPDHLLAETASQLQPITPRFVPQSHHVQLSCPDGGRPLVVLNKSYGGLAFPFSRFTHLYDAAEPGAECGFSDALREEIASRRPHGAVFAEVTGGAVTSNLNLHGRLVDHRIVCPGETAPVPEEARIHLDDLYIEHDDSDDRLVLRSHRLECEVIPVYLGYLVPIALPEIPRTLLLLSPSTMAPFDVWAGVPEGESIDGVSRRPRVRHRNVVVARRTWQARVEALPARRPGAGEEEHYLQWRRWQRAHGLPARCFATVSRSDQGPVGAKPVHVDFDSPLCLSVFDVLTDRSPGTQVAFREMLPTEDDLHLTSPRGRHVAELAVETFTTRRPPHSDQEAAPSCPN